MRPTTDRRSSSGGESARRHGIACALPASARPHRIVCTTVHSFAGSATLRHLRQCGVAFQNMSFEVAAKLLRANGARPSKILAISMALVAGIKDLLHRLHHPALLNRERPHRSSNRTCAQTPPTSQVGRLWKLDNSRPRFNGTSRRTAAVAPFPPFDLAPPLPALRR